MKFVWVNFFRIITRDGGGKVDFHFFSVICVAHVELPPGNFPGVYA
jgi:hypothetical protein